MSQPHHRRDFVRALALGASTPALLLGDEPATKKETKKTEVDARMELVLTRFGTQLDEAARAHVRSEIEEMVARAVALRKFPLGNGDGPMPEFVPYRAPLGLEPERPDPS